MGELLSSLDLSVSLAEIPVQQLQRIPTPAVLEHNLRIAILEGVDDDDGCGFWNRNTAPAHPRPACCRKAKTASNYCCCAADPTASNVGSAGAPAPSTLTNVSDEIAISRNAGPGNALGDHAADQCQIRGSDSLDAVISMASS